MERRETEGRSLNQSESNYMRCRWRLFRGWADAPSCSQHLTRHSTYADIISFNIAPISSIVPTTLPQRQVVNQ